MRSMATYMGEESSVQRPSITSSGPRRKGLKRAASETRRQNSSKAARAPSAPPLAWPSTSTAAFMAPADVPEMPSIPSHGSSSKRSSTPHVNAPCEPPPCNARSTRIGSRVKAVLVGSIGIGPRKNYGGAVNRLTGKYQHAGRTLIRDYGTAIATSPNEMRNYLGKAAAEVAEQRNDEDDNENE